MLQLYSPVFTVFTLFHSLGDTKDGAKVRLVSLMNMYVFHEAIVFTLFHSLIESRVCIKQKGCSGDTREDNKPVLAS